MESIRKIIKTNTPPSIMVPIIQTILSLPHLLSRYLIETFTSPTKAQMCWIKMIEKDTWKGAWIGPSMSECNDDAELFSRIQDADLIIYKAHGMKHHDIKCHNLQMDYFFSQFLHVFIRWRISNWKCCHVYGCLSNLDQPLKRASQYQCIDFISGL